MNPKIAQILSYPADLSDVAELTDVLLRNAQPNGLGTTGRVDCLSYLAQARHSSLGDPALTASRSTSMAARSRGGWYS